MIGRLAFPRRRSSEKIMVVEGRRQAKEDIRSVEARRGIE